MSTSALQLGSITIEAADPQILAAFVAWGQRQPEVDRLTALGATLRWEVLDEHPGMRLTALADPEDNLFCVVEVQSA